MQGTTTLANVATQNEEIYEPARDVNNNIIWETEENWMPLTWTQVPVLDEIPKPIPPLQHHHQGQKPKPKKRFSCSECNKMYARRPDANIHAVEVHLSFFRFQCRECDFKTSRNYHLTKHISKTNHRPWNTIRAHRVKPHYRYNANANQLQRSFSISPATPTTTTPFVDSFSPISPQ